MSSNDTIASLNFIEQIVEGDLATGAKGDIVYTRFPPEPNGYLHMGHVKSIYLNFSLAKKYGGKTNLRFDDTNPSKENMEFVQSMMDDIHWLGYDWEGEPKYASNYFGQVYAWAQQLIREG